MPSSRIVIRLLEFAESCGVPEEIVGDLLEEMHGGRSRRRIVRELVALGGAAGSRYLRDQARITPQRVAVVIGALMLTAVVTVPVDRVLSVWLVVYYATGMASLFAHMVSGASSREPHRSAVDVSTD